MSAEIITSQRIEKLSGIVGIPGFDFCPGMTVGSWGDDRMFFFGEGLPNEMFLNIFSLLVLDGKGYIPDAWKKFKMRPKMAILQSEEIGYLIYNQHIDKIKGLANGRFELTSVYPDTKDKGLLMGDGCRWSSYIIQDQFTIKARR